jgi:hypothetical protein
MIAATTARTTVTLSAARSAAMVWAGSAQRAEVEALAFAREYDQATIAWYAAPEGSELAHQRGLARRAIYARAFRAGYRLR